MKTKEFSFMDSLPKKAGVYCKCGKLLVGDVKLYIYGVVACKCGRSIFKYISQYHTKNDKRLFFNACSRHGQKKKSSMKGGENNMRKAVVGLGLVLLGAGSAMATSTNALEEIQALATSTGSATVLATIAGLVVFAAIFLVRKLRSGVSAGAGR